MNFALRTLSTAAAVLSIIVTRKLNVCRQFAPFRQTISELSTWRQARTLPTGLGSRPDANIEIWASKQSTENSSYKQN